MQFHFSGSYNAQGIGFLNDSVGWIGGGVSNYKTVNGGLTWSLENFGTPINRFRFFGDTLGYAAGKYIYKFQSSSTGVGTWGPKQAEPLSVYPNPFSSSLTISKPPMPGASATLWIFDCMGRQVFTRKLSNSMQETIDPHLEKGIYFYHIISSDNRSWSGELIRID
ncbi:MAG TPA: T9SS type A sorting domain-containing protein [Bacteroidia bacterium]|jgi:hypothetical protein